LREGLNNLKEVNTMKNFFYFFVLGIVFNNSIAAQSGTDTIEVSTGWNLIGGLTTGYIPSIISTVPPGIITGSVFGYTPGSGYQAADTLKRGKGYWVKVSQNGIIIFGFALNCGTVNYSGKIYSTVIIGTQCWLKENLDVGVMIPGSQNQNNTGTVEKYCYNNDPNNCYIYGGLYQWDEAMQYVTTEGTQGICPPGWHLPTIAELQTLSSTVNNDGNSLKAIGQGTGGGAGTNTSGFSALLAGRGGGFYDLGYATYFWSSSEYNATDAYFLGLGFDASYISLIPIFKFLGFSVRCLKN
jgi:uncharacterized protein (TIGR02145 family)